MNTVNERGIGSDVRRNYIASGESGGTLGISIVQGREVPEEHMALTDIRALRAQRASQSSVGDARESDDGFDFPPTAHPGRELFTASLFVLLIMALLVWGGWKLISLI